MDTKNDNTIKNLCVTPVVLIGICAVSLILAGLLEFPLNRDGLYLFFGLIGGVLLFLGSLPCLIMSIAALILCHKRNQKRFIVFASINTTVSAIWFFLSVLLFIGGQSV